MKILFVEDNVNTARAMKMMLELRGYHVETAGTVAKALALLQSDTYDLLISDISLPDGTGYDILARMSSPISSIALTGYISEDDRNESISKGFSEFITKPFKPEELVAAIERLK